MDADSPYYYKRLNSGYHYVVDRRAAHRFVQWPVGREPAQADISHNGADQRTLEDLLRAASTLAQIRGAPDEHE